MKRKYICSKGKSILVILTNITNIDYNYGLQTYIVFINYTLTNCTRRYPETRKWRIIMIIHGSTVQWRLGPTNPLLAHIQLFTDMVNGYPTSIRVTCGHHNESLSNCWLSRPGLLILINNNPKSSRSWVGTDLPWGELNLWPLRARQWLCLYAT